jgi:hypothetical protein
VSLGISTSDSAEEMVTINADTQSQGRVDVHALMARWSASDREAADRVQQAVGRVGVLRELLEP